MVGGCGEAKGAALPHQPTKVQWVLGKQDNKTVSYANKALAGLRLPKW